MTTFSRCTSVYVTKRDGSHEKLSLDAIQDRVEKLCTGLAVQDEEGSNYGIEPVCYISQTRLF